MPECPDGHASEPPRWARVRRVLATMVFSTLAGCAQSKGEVFPPVQPAIVWPPLPDTPRIQYVGALATEADLKPGKSLFKGLGEALFGKDSIRAMLSPYSVCVDSTRQRLFVCDSNAQMVHVFNLDNRRYEQWRPPEDGHAGFSQPIGVTLDSRDRLLVSDPVAGTIFAFDAGDGRFLGELGSENLKRPCGLAYDAVRDRLFVADTGLHQIVVLALDGEVIAAIGERGSAPGQFNYPTNVAVDSMGRLFVSDTLNFRVQVFDTDFKPMRTIGRLGDMPGYFAQPKGLALDSENHLYVIDAQFEVVQVFDADGRLLMHFGEEGQGPGQFWLPTGMAIDDSDRIWIADSYNKRVQVFDYRPEVQP